MKNTPENKAKFFAQYWGQEVGVEVFGERSSELKYRINELTIDPVGRDYLELKPLSQITDEDSVGVAKLGYSVENYSGDLQKFIKKPQTGKDWIASNSGGHSFTKLESSISIIDFLRSKGYALPWMGISVEEQIEFGWVKLKE